LLTELYPSTFSLYEGRRHPLKIGIHHDLLAALGGAVTAAELKQALQCYTLNKVYRARLQEGAIRLDLDGKKSGVVAAEHAVGDRHSKKATPG
jgi:sRNA-binding protein